MRRRDLIALLGGTAMAWPLRSLADTPAKVYRLAMLTTGAPDGGIFGTTLVRGLALHGYTPDQNLVLERHGAEGHADRVPQLLADILASKVDVIVTFGYQPTLEAKLATTLPVVAFSAGDPIGTGLVDSLARPGGHLTGISDVSAEVTPKRLELLKQFAPGLRRVAVLFNADDPAMMLRYVAAEGSAKALGVSLLPLGVREPADFAQAFGAMTRELPDGILLVSDPLTNLNRKLIFDFAEAHRLPAIYEYDFIARDGGLMSYGVDLDETFDRVGGLIDRIFKGANAGDLPFEQPTKFRFVLNQKAAKAIGFAAPPSLLALADEVIE
jgi:putative tryptophan/tyrosine transport system substrate-binding protein